MSRISRYDSTVTVLCELVALLDRRGIHLIEIVFCNWFDLYFCAFLSVNSFNLYVTKVRKSLGELPLISFFSRIGI